MTFIPIDFILLFIHNDLMLNTDALILKAGGKDEF